MYDRHPQPVTGATTMLYALDWIADRIIEEGLENRQERFRSAGELLKKGMSEIGFRSGADPEYASPVVTEFITPDGIPAQDVRDYYMKVHNTMVGFGRRTNDAGMEISYRIAHFGRAAETWRVNRMIAITKEFMEGRGK